MKITAPTVASLLILFFTSGFSSVLPEQGGPQSVEASQPGSVSQIPQVPQPSEPSQEILRLVEGKSMVVNSAENLKRVSVTNDLIATAIIISPNQVLLHGIKPGTVTLLLWNEQEQIRAFELQVLQAKIDLEPLRATLKRVLSGETIELSQSGSSVVLTGTVSSTAVADQAKAVIQTEVPNVVNLLGTAPMNQVVLLEVKFAEVDRNAARQLGINIFSTGATNTIGTVSTQQFSPVATQSVGGASTFSLGDLLNIFVFRPDLDLGVTIKALQNKNLLQILAEPNLLALGGKEASFLAGGELPIPIVQGSTGVPIVSIQFKEFGVRLKFVADIKPDGAISLRVAPEVSTLDYSNAVTLQGFLIPAFQTRKADTEVQLRDGQSFAIAGLMDNRVTKVYNKIPMLGDLPLLGKLFQSEEFRKNNSELLVTVTPRLVKPLEAGQVPALPQFPVPFLDNQKFDGKSTQTPPANEPKHP